MVRRDGAFLLGFAGTASRQAALPEASEGAWRRQSSYAFRLNCFGEGAHLEPARATHCVAPVRRLERASAEAEGGAAWTVAIVIRARLPGGRGIAPAKGQAGARGFVDGQIREVNAAAWRAPTEAISRCRYQGSRRSVRMARGRLTVALETYRAKRDFSATAEPAGTDRRGEGDAFVVQKHAARRLHYDLRLEIGDVLASWAVTRGPSLVPGEKRLAVHVEDHPLDYADFEGEIAKGEYGAGEVIVWDRGRWEPEGDPARGLRKGRLDFTLDGAKLKGRWHLVRMAGKRGEKRENWLLIKGSDAEARDASAPDILEEAPESVISGRTIEDVAAGKPARRKPAARKGADPFPGFVPPALATLVADARRAERPGCTRSSSTATGCRRRSAGPRRSS